MDVNVFLGREATVSDLMALTEQGYEIFIEDGVTKIVEE